MKRLNFTLFIICIAFSVTVVAQPTIIMNSVITGLNVPIQITHAGDGTNRIFIVEKGGLIKVYSKSYVLLDTLLTLTGLPTASNEQGLLGVVFHPNFYSNGYLYINYTKSNNNTVIDRYTISSTNANEVNPATKLNILDIPHTFTNHNGGEMHFGKDGYLYISTGDGGSGGDPENNAQNNNSLLGKILRINVDATSGTQNYTIPADNPIAGNALYVKGLRNPFRWSFDRYTGDMWIGDVGQSAKEEIDFIAKADIAGSNLGWRCYEGNNTYNTSGCASISAYKFPLYDYAYSSTSKSIIGGVRYRGYKYPDLKGYYFAIDYFSNSLKLINNINNTWSTSSQTFATSYKGICDFGETEDGELYAVDHDNNVVYQVSNSNAKTVYTFSGTDDWMKPSNWRDGAVPPNPLPSGSVIAIKPRFGGNCTLSNVVTIATGADVFVEPNCNFVVNTTMNID